MANKKQNKTYEYDFYLENGRKRICLNSKETPAEVIDGIIRTGWYIANSDYSVVINCNKVVEIEVKEYEG